MLQTRTTTPVSTPRRIRLTAGEQRLLHLQAGAELRCLEGGLQLRCSGSDWALPSIGLGTMQAWRMPDVAAGWVSITAGPETVLQVVTATSPAARPQALQALEGCDPAAAERAQKSRQGRLPWRLWGSTLGGWAAQWRVRRGQRAA